MVASNSTHIDQGAVGEFAVGEFNQGNQFNANIYSIYQNPVWPRRGLAARHQQALAYVGVPPLNEAVLYSKFAYQWSTPVRLPKGLKPYLQPFFATDPTPFPTGQNLAWWAPFRDPVRLPKGLKAHLQRDFTIDTNWIQAPSVLVEGWYNWYTEPVRQRLGLRAYLQQALAFPPRLLPTSIVVTMNAIESNQDVALFGVYVYSGSQPSGGATSASVSIVETQVPDGGAVSVEG